MQGSARKNLMMFRQLCGEGALKKVILATSRWDEVEHEVGVKRETELTETPEFWGWMMERERLPPTRQHGSIGKSHCS